MSLFVNWTWTNASNILLRPGWCRSKRSNPQSKWSSPSHLRSATWTYWQNSLLAGWWGKVHSFLAPQANQLDECNYLSLGVGAYLPWHILQCVPAWEAPKPLQLFNYGVWIPWACPYFLDNWIIVKYVQAEDAWKHYAISTTDTLSNS